MRRFANPHNGYVEDVGTISVMLTVLFGPLYLAYRGAWFAALLFLLAAPVAFAVVLLITGGAVGGTLVLFFGSILLLALAVQPLVCKAYLKRGWHEVAAEA